MRRIVNPGPTSGAGVNAFGDDGVLDLSDGDVRYRFGDSALGDEYLNALLLTPLDLLTADGDDDALDGETLIG